MKEIVNTELSIEKKKLLSSLIGSELACIYYNKVTSLLSDKYDDMENHGFLLEFKTKGKVSFLEFNNIGFYTKFHELITGIDLKIGSSPKKKTSVLKYPFIIKTIKIWGKDINWKLMKSEMDPKSDFMVMWRSSHQPKPDIDFHFSTDVCIEFIGIEYKHSLLLMATEDCNGGMTFTIGNENSKKLLNESIENYFIKVRKVLG